ncbi:flavodoxin [Treponema pectinovorum]|uniref:flavodoxin n=1 Tax=Treponema pectinovorum TaxID=164 RepID=UPI003D9489A7
MKKIILIFSFLIAFAFSVSAKSLVVYFSVPETTKTTKLTRNEENSLVVIDGKALGNVQYIAQIIAEKTESDIWRIEAQNAYPTDHKALLERAAKEKKENARPKIKGKIENFSEYDTVFVGYPNWNADLPPILYTFFEDYDLSRKKIIPFNVHGGSGLSRTVSTIENLEPKANVEKNAFSESRTSVESCKERVIAWLKKIGF